MNEPAKIEKVTDDALSRSIISSVIGILLCMVCLVGTTWAWYSSSVTSGVSVTEGANFDFSVEIMEPVEATDGVYHFESGTHTVTLTKNCTATKGFCKVEATKTGEETNTSYYIVDFTGKEFIEFTVKGSGTLKLIPMWGTPTSDYTEIPSEGIALTPDATAMMSQPKPETQPDEMVLPTDGETGTSEGNTTEGGQIPPDAGETQSSDTPTNPETAEPGTPTESEQEPPAEQPSETTTQE